MLPSGPITAPDTDETFNGSSESQCAVSNSTTRPALDWASPRRVRHRSGSLTQESYAANHSARSGVDGSLRAARAAGTPHAATATTSSVVASTANTIGSFGLTS